MFPAGGERIRSLTQASVRTIIAGEKAVEKAAAKQFQSARLAASLAVGLFVVGFLLVAQWRGVDHYESRLEARSDQDLGFVVHELGLENDDLRREALRLEQRIAEAERTGEGQEAVLNEAVRELQSLRILSGLEGAVGAGLSILISDPEHVVLARDLVDVVNELRAAGAEAISVDGTRLGATSGLADVDGIVVVDGRPVTGDIVLFAIGDPLTLSQALSMPGGVAAGLNSFPGVTVEIREQETVEVAAAQIRPLSLGTASDE